MRLKVLFYCVCIVILSSCGASKKTTHKKKNAGVVLQESKPKKAPSVNQKELIKKLVKKNPKLKSQLLIFILAILDGTENVCIMMMMKKENVLENTNM